MLLGGDLAATDATLDAISAGLGASDACPGIARGDYEDELYTGRYADFSGCEGTDAVFTAIVASPPGAEFTIYAGVQLRSDADQAALERIVATFQNIG